MQHKFEVVPEEIDIDQEDNCYKSSLNIGGQSEVVMESIQSHYPMNITIENKKEELKKDPVEYE